MKRRALLAVFGCLVSLGPINVFASTIPSPSDVPVPPAPSGGLIESLNTLAPTDTFEPTLSPSIITGSPSKSAAPSDYPSLVPSTTPTYSSSPTFIPTFRPTTGPPSAIPSQQPSQAPSLSPSFLPTPSPSNFPSSSPTRRPTSNPTTSPSASPSTAPSESCHDVANYQSPINGFSCSDHNGTDCTEWRHLGLSVDEVEELIDNCPISCKVECGTSSRFETIFSFKLWNIDTFLSPAAVLAMNNVAVDFMTDYVSQLEPGSTFFLDETVLIAQQFATNQPLRNLRALEQIVPSSALRIDLEFRGYAIRLDKVTIDSRLRDALFSPPFTLALQRSGDPTFTNAQVDAVGSLQPNQGGQNEAGDGASPGGITAAILGSLIIVAAVGVYAFKYNQKQGQPKDLDPGNHTVFNNFPASPNQSVLSPASSFSMEAASNMVSRIARIVTSFSPRSVNDDDSTQSADISGSDSNESVSRELAFAQANRYTEGHTIEEGDEDESPDEEGDDREHPYAGIIPPMIVIDNIEDYPSTMPSQYTTKDQRRVKRVVPTMHIDASPDLIAALSDTSKPFDPSTFSEYVQSRTPMASEEGNSGKIYDNLQVQGCGSSFNLFSSQDEGEEIYDSSTDSDDDSSDALFEKLRKSGSLEENSGTSGSRSDFRSRRPLSISSMTRPPRVPSEGSQRNSPKSAHSSPVITREKSTVDGYLSDDPATKEHVSRKEGGGFLHSLWNKSPRNKNPPSVSSKSDSFGESIRRWSHHARSNSRGSYETPNSMEEEGTLLTFHAPKGKLGLVLECSTESTPIIAKVKDYSPLLDQVLPGDRIVLIDNTSTDKMGMRDVMTLLEGKSSRIGSVCLKILRSNSDSLDGVTSQRKRSPTTSHLSFDGAGSHGTTSDHDSPHQFAYKSPSTSLGSASTVPTGVKRSRSETDIPQATK